MAWPVFSDGVAFHILIEQLIRIEFRSIWRQQVHVQPRMFHQEATDAFSPVWQTTVPEQHHVTPDLTKQHLEELDDLFSTDVSVRVKSTVQSKPSVLG